MGVEKAELNPKMLYKWLLTESVSIGYFKIKYVIYFSLGIRVSPCLHQKNSVLLSTKYINYLFLL